MSSDMLIGSQLEEAPQQEKEYSSTEISSFRSEGRKAFSELGPGGASANPYINGPLTPRAAQHWWSGFNEARQKQLRKDAASEDVNKDQKGKSAKTNTTTTNYYHLNYNQAQQQTEWEQKSSIKQVKVTKSKRS